jgi:hypothetical protein
MKKVVYSCLFYDGKRIVDKPHIDEDNKLEDWDYVIFTNIPDELKDSGWTPMYKKLIKNHPIYTAKCYKWLAYRYLTNYDIAIYVDAYLAPITTDWDKYINKLSTDGIENGVIMMKHSRFECIYAECYEIIRCKRDTEENMCKVMRFLKENNMPVNYGLYEGGLFIRHLKNTDFNNFCNELFVHMLNFTYRDQALLSYVCWKHGIKFNGELNKDFYFVSGEMGNHIYVD